MTLESDEESEIFNISSSISSTNRKDIKQFQVQDKAGTYRKEDISEKSQKPAILKVSFL